MKDRDFVLVHPDRHTVHEIGADGKPYCGNGRGDRPSDQIYYERMKRSEADADPRTKPCGNRGCKAMRRRRRS